LNTADYHRSSYNFWDLEDSIIGKPAYVIGLKDSLVNNPLDPGARKHTYDRKVDNYFSFSKIRFTHIEKAAIKNGILQLTCIIKTPATYLPLLKQSPYDTTSAYIASYSRSTNTISYYKTDLKVNQITKQQMEKNLLCAISPQEAPEALWIVLGTCLPGVFSLNSDFFKPVYY
jgi:hypothetical protein